MRSSVPHCPTCGQPAHGIWENVPATAMLIRDGDGFDYYGESRMHWDGQGPELDELGRVTLVCGAGHEWPAEMLDGTDSARGSLAGVRVHHSGCLLYVVASAMLLWLLPSSESGEGLWARNAEGQ